MTREEAAKTLPELWGVDYHYYLREKEAEAVDMAIEALEQIRAIEGIIDVSNITIQEDVLKYKMIVDIVKGGC